MKKTVIRLLSILLAISFFSCAKKAEDLTGYYELISLIRDGEEVLTDEIKEVMTENGWIISLEVAENKGTLYDLGEEGDHFQFNTRNMTYSSQLMTLYYPDAKSPTFSLTEGKLTLNDYNEGVYVFEKKERPVQETVPADPETQNGTDPAAVKPSGDVIVVENDYLTLYIPFELEMIGASPEKMKENQNFFISMDTEAWGLTESFPLNTEDETEQSYLNSYKNYTSQLTPIGNDRSFMVIDSPINENEMLFYAMLFTDEYAHWFIVAFAPEQKESYMPLLYEMLATAVPKK